MDEIYKTQIEAYVDNELDDEQRQKLEETMMNYPALQDYADKMFKQKAILKSWWELNKKNHH